MKYNKDIFIGFQDKRVTKTPINNFFCSFWFVCVLHWIPQENSCLTFPRYEKFMNNANMFNFYLMSEF
jgi:hypothetical protein